MTTEWLLKISVQIKKEKEKIENESKKLSKTQRPQHQQQSKCAIAELGLPQITIGLLKYIAPNSVNEKIVVTSQRL